MLFRSGIDGWAIENRVYAEDPYRGFLPSTGRLVRYDPPVPGSFESFETVQTKSSPPQDERDVKSTVRPEERGRSPNVSKGLSRDELRGTAGIRVDDGVMEGGEVSIFYDPMIAKLITWAPTRDQAADLQIAALDAFEIEGLGHNIDFVSAIMQHPRFRSGALTDRKSVV